jgi:hypothetical protein
LHEVRETLALDPDFWRSHHGMGVTLVPSGDAAGGPAQVERARRLGGEGGGTEAPGHGP